MSVAIIIMCVKVVVVVRVDVLFSVVCHEEDILVAFTRAHTLTHSQKYV